jgi:4-hydroxy-3-methylbut-2-en-1-yl diphosphate reductase
MKIEIDSSSGFCFGVRKAIDTAEKLLAEKEELFCLGDIVHNHEEVDRLSKKGMTTIQKEDSNGLTNKTVLIRTHGEPPSTYTQLTETKNKIIDATCPVVLKLQERIKTSFDAISKDNGQLIIIGKHGHAEVIGLDGQTGNQSIIISSEEDIQQIDFSKPIEVYSQTTMPIDLFQKLSTEIKNKAQNSITIHDTICRQVANRIPRLIEFSKNFDVILFVSGKKSSNGKLLYNVCLKNNLKSFFVTCTEDIEKQWFSEVESIGICGATSTPQWLMENVAQHVRTILNNSK